jgi:hypothetical protein
LPTTPTRAGSATSRPSPSAATTVRNLSTQPAHYALVQVGIDTELTLGSVNDFLFLKRTDDPPQVWMGHQFSSPPGIPIFKEIDQDALHRLSLPFTYPSNRLGGETRFYLTTSVQTAGYTATGNWVIRHRGGRLKLFPPSRRRPNDD